MLKRDSWELLYSHLGKVCTFLVWIELETWKLFEGMAQHATRTSKITHNVHLQSDEVGFGIWYLGTMIRYHEVCDFSRPGAEGK